MSPSHQPEAAAEPPLEVLPAEPGLPSEERLGSLDLIRGIAILCILPVNMSAYMGPTGFLAPPQPVIQWWGDVLVAAAILFFFNGKLLTQLAILFGAGLAIQGDRADAADRPFTGYYVRRMVLLLLLGVGHALLLWWGDILWSYALLGLAALALRRLSQRALLWCIGGLLAWSYLLMFGFAVVAAVIDDPPGSQPPDADEASMPTLAYYLSTPNELRIYRHGPWSEMVVNRAFHVAFLLVIFGIWAFWDLLACFLLGIWLLRQGVFQRVEEHRTLLRRFVLFGLGVGVPLHLGAVALYLRNPLDPLAFLINTAGAIPQALAYLALALFWHHSGALAWLQTRLQMVGRMALTNYLMQSVICGFVFYSYGLGLFGTWGITAGFALTVGIWVLELAWSPVWLRHFHMGPVEWLWRSLADGRLRPFRLRPST